MINSYDEYKSLLLKCIRKRSLDILEGIVDDKENEKYIKRLVNDNLEKENIINNMLKMNDYRLCNIIFNLFEINEELPECENISDIIYLGDCIYGSNLINKKTNIYYIFDDNNLEEFDKEIFSMDSLYYLCEDEKYFNMIKLKIEDKICRRLNREEEIYILTKSREYRDYINNEYKSLLEDVVENEGVMDSNMECYNVLYNYLGRKPNKFEVKLLMDIGS